MTYAFAAAGTGGHIYPALAVARSLVEMGVPNGDIVFFGGDRLETRAVPEAGFEFIQLDVRGLKRSLSVENLTIPAMVRRAAKNVEATLARRSPGALTVFGGYVTVPAAIGARKVGMPYVIHEQNAVPGLANRYVARRAARTLAAFAPALERLPGAEIVGNPLDSRFSSFDRSGSRTEAMRRYGLDPGLPVVGIVGGSLGAASLNGVAATLADDSERRFSILHLTGVAHHDEIAGVAASHENWITVPFESNMPSFYAASDLVLSRAGAMTVSELAATGTPSVVVPLPAGKGYQARNADDLSREGGSIIVEQEAIAEVPGILRSLISDPGRLSAMRAAALSVAKPDAARRVATIVQEVAGG